jgi:peptide methionine sulfoxide reductase MsrA
VQVTYEPKKISYGQVLKVFFDVAHDPTQLNRQDRMSARTTGPPFSIPIRNRKELPKRIYDSWIKLKYSARRFVTEVVELKTFYPAEEHHQNFCNRHPQNPYVVKRSDAKGGQGQEAGSRTGEAEITRAPRSPLAKISETAVLAQASLISVPFATGLL